MDECNDSSGHALIFFSLNTNLSCRQIQIDDVDHKKAAFSSFRRRLRFSRIPIQLDSAPYTSQRTLDVILSPIERQFVKCILTILSNFPAMKTVIHRMFALCCRSYLVHKADVTFNLKNGGSFTKKIDYIMHKIGLGR